MVATSCLSHVHAWKYRSDLLGGRDWGPVRGKGIRKENGRECEEEGEGEEEEGEEEEENPMVVYLSRGPDVLGKMFELPIEILMH